MLRKMMLKDLDEVMAIWLEANCVAHDFISSKYWLDNYSEVRKMLPEAQVTVFVEKGEILGFIGLENNYLAGIFVKKSSQGKGIGKSLLNEAKKSNPSLTLHVYQNNTSGINFYFHEGFKILKEDLDESTGEKEWVMVWEK